MNGEIFLNAINGAKYKAIPYGENEKILREIIPVQEQLINNGHHKLNG